MLSGKDGRDIHRIFVT